VANYEFITRARVTRVSWFNVNNQHVLHEGKRPL